MKRQHDCNLSTIETRPDPDAAAPIGDQPIAGLVGRSGSCP